MNLQYETSFTIKAEIQERRAAILPIGAVEAHGPHLPLGTDNILSERLAEELGNRTESLVLPLLPYGQVWSLKNFPGSIGISNATLISLVVDIGKSLYEQGFRVMAIVNGHLGNGTALKEASRRLYEDCKGLKVLVFFYPGASNVIGQVMESPRQHESFFHACEIETSYMLYLAPEHVDMSLAPEEIAAIPATVDLTPTPWEQFTQTAVLGNAKLATREKGQTIIDAVMRNMEHFLKQAIQESHSEGG